MRETHSKPIITEKVVIMIFKHLVHSEGNTQLLEFSEGTSPCLVDTQTHLLYSVR